MSEQKTLLLFICICLCSPSLSVADSDTTYSRIRIKERSKSSGGSESESSRDDSFLSSCMESCVSGAFDGCLDGLFNRDGNTKFIYDDDDKDNDNRSQPREREIVKTQIVNPCTYSSEPFHFLIGATLGGVIYSKGIAAGFVPGGTVGITWYPDIFLGLRLTIEPTAGFDNILVDMEKDVFVDGVQVGTTIFRAERGKEFILPLALQLQFLPPVSGRTMFFSFGGGPYYKHETVRGKRTFNGTISDREIELDQWCPFLQIGMGFFIPLNKTFGILELGYRIMSNQNKQIFETPGDNSRYAHIPSITFSISTP